MTDAVGVELAVGDRVVVVDAWYFTPAGLGYRSSKKSHGVFWATVTRFTNARIGVTFDDGYRIGELRQSHQVMFISR